VPHWGREGQQRSLTSPLHRVLSCPHKCRSDPIECHPIFQAGHSSRTETAVPTAHSRFWVAEIKRVADELSLSRSPSPPKTKPQMELTCPLSTVVFVEGKPQRPHRRLVALSSRPLVLRSSVVNSVGEQIPRRSRHRSNVSDV
jgi:hypothetical protein